MSDITDVVKALSELATSFRNQAAESLNDENHSVEYDMGKMTALISAAIQVDALMIGPAMQAALDEMDGRT